MLTNITHAAPRFISSFTKKAKGVSFLFIFTVPACINTVLQHACRQHVSLQKINTIIVAKRDFGRKVK